MHTCSLFGSIAAFLTLENFPAHCEYRTNNDLYLHRSGARVWTCHVVFFWTQSRVSSFSFQGLSGGTAYYSMGSVLFYSTISRCYRRLPLPRADPLNSTDLTTQTRKETAKFLGTCPTAAAAAAAATTGHQNLSFPAVRVRSRERNAPILQQRIANQSFWFETCSAVIVWESVAGLR